MPPLALFLAIVLPAAEPLDTVEAQQRVAQSSCVRISDMGETRSGSGVVIAWREGYLYILTANHVIANAKGLQVHPYPADLFPKQGKALADVDLLVQAAEIDLALIRVPAGMQLLTPVPLRSPGESSLGTDFAALTVGCDSFGVPERQEDRIAGKRLLRRPGGTTLFVWEGQKKPEPGRSGGPLLNAQRQVIGICIGTQDGKGYYCHLDEIHAALKERKYTWLWKPEKK